MDPEYVYTLSSTRILTFLISFDELNALLLILLTHSICLALSCLYASCSVILNPTSFPLSGRQPRNFRGSLGIDLIALGLNPKTDLVLKSSKLYNKQRVHIGWLRRKEVTITEL